MKKRFIALLLCCVMLLTLSPSLISAASATDINGTTQSTEGQVTTGEATDTSGTETSTGLQPDATSGNNPPADPQPVSSEKPAECTCDSKLAEGEAHNEGCPLYAKPGFDAAKAKENLLACETIEAVEAYFASLTEGQQEAVLSLFTEPEIREFAERLGIDVETKVVTPPVDYTKAGPLKEAVQTALKRRIARSKDNKEENGLILNKTATYNPQTKTVTITMEAYTTGTITTSSHSTPVDVVLVLDESGSMKDSMQSFEKVYTLNTSETYYVKNGDSYIQVKWCNGGFFKIHDSGWYSGGHFIIHWGERYDPMTSETDSDPSHIQFYESIDASQTKQEALISAASDFVDKVYQDATENEVDHRISVIGFSSSANTKIGLVNDIRENQTDVKNAISGLTADGGTYIEKGLSNAKNVFDNAATTGATTRKRVVVVFTDGIPGSGTWNNTTINESANPAISTAKDLKGTYGATVYTIGMLPEANPELEISNETNDSARTNKFLHYVSSNYPNASSMSDGGNGSNAGYYLSASDMASLNAIFTKISEEISTPSIQLDGGTQIRDTIMPQFTVPEGTDSINLFTEDYDGTQFDGTRDSAPGVTAAINENTINVTGFDFNANFVSDTAKSDGSYGKKLIIEFTVTPKAGFLGGNDVPTNGADSGVYDKDGSAVESFPVPKVNVPIEDVTVTAEEKNVYLRGDLTAAQLKEGATVNVGDVELKLNESNYGLEAWQAAYVNITVEVKDKDGNVINTGLTDLTDDTTYTISVTVAPKNEALGTSSGTPATKKSNTGTGNINVFKPELTFQDSEVYYGDTAPDYTGNLTDTEWKHGETLSDAEGVTMIGTAPTLALTYTPEEGKIAGEKINTKQDIAVDVAVKIDEADVTTHTTFQHTDCEGRTCTVPAGKEFLLHVKTCQLTITKNGGNANEPYVFTVFKDNEKYSEVTVMGGGSETICELPVGTYTIEEETGWSWRFTPTIGGGVTLSKDKASNTITCTNTKANDYWLNGFSNVEKNIFGVKH